MQKTVHHEVYIYKRSWILFVRSKISPVVFIWSSPVVQFSSIHHWTGHVDTELDHGYWTEHHVDTELDHVGLLNWTIEPRDAELYCFEKKAAIRMSPWNAFSQVVSHSCISPNVVLSPCCRNRTLPPKLDRCFNKLKTDNWLIYALSSKLLEEYIQYSQWLRKPPDRATPNYFENHLNTTQSLFHTIHHLSWHFISHKLFWRWLQRMKGTKL